MFSACTSYADATTVDTTYSWYCSRHTNDTFIRIPPYPPTHTSLLAHLYLQHRIVDIQHLPLAQNMTFEQIHNARLKQCMTEWVDGNNTYDKATQQSALNHLCSIDKLLLDIQSLPSTHSLGERSQNVTFKSIEHDYLNKDCFCIVSDDERNDRFYYRCVQDIVRGSVEDFVDRIKDTVLRSKYVHRSDAVQSEMEWFTQELVCTLINHFLRDDSSPASDATLSEMQRRLLPIVEREIVQMRDYMTMCMHAMECIEAIATSASTLQSEESLQNLLCVMQKDIKSIHEFFRHVPHVFMKLCEELNLPIEAFCVSVGAPIPIAHVNRRIASKHCNTVVSWGKIIDMTVEYFSECKHVTGMVKACRLSRNHLKDLMSDRAMDPSKWALDVSCATRSDMLWPRSCMVEMPYHFASEDVLHVVTGGSRDSNDKELAMCSMYKIIETVLQAKIVRPQTVMARFILPYIHRYKHDEVTILIRRVYEEHSSLEALGTDIPLTKDDINNLICEVEDQVVDEHRDGIMEELENVVHTCVEHILDEKDDVELVDHVNKKGAASVTFPNLSNCTSSRIQLMCTGVPDMIYRDFIIVMAIMDEVPKCGGTLFFASVSKLLCDMELLKGHTQSSVTQSVTFVAKKLVDMCNNMIDPTEDAHIHLVSSRKNTSARTSYMQMNPKGALVLVEACMSTMNIMKHDRRRMEEEWKPSRTSRKRSKQSHTGTGL